MPYPPEIYYSSEVDYKSHFEREYCQSTIKTHDGIEVRFRKRDYDHCFFESVHSKDDTFSQIRAERIDWIKAALQDSNAGQFQGWDKIRHRYDPNVRVILVEGDYVVIIRIKSSNSADFITAFVADTHAPPGGMSTADKIRNLSPKWR